MLLDPYLGAGDLYYAYLIQNTTVPIQILSSDAFLKKKVQLSPGRTTREAYRLSRALDRYRRALPGQSIQIRVLLGSKSPLHDRYLVVDDSVYLLGSSLNEFGSRATTLIKVAAPRPMMAQALAWWGDPVKTQALDDYVHSLKSAR